VKNVCIDYIKISNLINSSKDKELEELLEVSNENVQFPVSCQEYADNGVTENGTYRVQPNSNISRKCNTD